MRKRILSGLVMQFTVICTIAQLHPTRLENTFTYDSKGGHIRILNDSIQFSTTKGRIDVLKNFVKTSTVTHERINTYSYDVANSGSSRNEIFIVFSGTPIEKDSTLIFLHKINEEGNKLIPMSFPAYLLKRAGLSSNFYIGTHAYDRIKNVIYFANDKTIIRYSVMQNEFSIIPVKVDFEIRIMHAEDDHVYLAKRGFGKIDFVQSFSALNPQELKIHREINTAIHDFIRSTDGKQMYITQGAKTFLIKGNTLQEMPSSFVVRKAKGYSTNDKRSVKIVYNESKKEDTILLKYALIHVLEMGDKLIVTYNSNQESQNQSKPAESPVATDTQEKTPSFEVEFSKRVQSFFATKDAWFNKILEFNKCMKEKVYFDCQNLRYELKALKLDSKLNECNYLLNQISKYEAALKIRYGIENVELMKFHLIDAKSGIMRVQKEL